MKVIDVRAFAPSEEALYAEASALGFAVGEVPNYITVTSGDGKEATYRLQGVFELEFAYELIGYAEPTNERTRTEGAARWTPRRMVIWND